MHARCEECRKATQKICLDCNTLTRKQFHDRCHGMIHVPDLGRGCLTEQVHGTHRKGRTIRIILLSLGILGALLGGIAIAPIHGDTAAGVMRPTVADPQIVQAEQAQQNLSVV